MFSEGFRTVIFFKIKYLRQIIDKNSRRLDPVRTSAINDMPASENVCSLKKFHGFSKFLQRICAKLALLASIIEQTIKKMLNEFQRLSSRKHW